MLQDPIFLGIFSWHSLFSRFWNISIFVINRRWQDVYMFFNGKKGGRASLSVSALFVPNFTITGFFTTNCELPLRHGQELLARGLWRRHSSPLTRDDLAYVVLLMSFMISSNLMVSWSERVSEWEPQIKASLWFIRISAFVYVSYCCCCQSRSRLLVLIIIIVAQVGQPSRSEELRKNTTAQAGLRKARSTNVHVELI